MGASRDAAGLGGLKVSPRGFPPRRAILTPPTREHAAFSARRMSPSPANIRRASAARLIWLVALWAMSLPATPAVTHASRPSPARPCLPRSRRQRVGPGRKRRRGAGRSTGVDCRPGRHWSRCGDQRGFQDQLRRRLHRVVCPGNRRRADRSGPAQFALRPLGRRRRLRRWLRADGERDHLHRHLRGAPGAAHRRPLRLRRQPGRQHDSRNISSTSQGSDTTATRWPAGRRFTSRSRHLSGSSTSRTTRATGLASTGSTR